MKTLLRQGDEEVKQIAQYFGLKTDLLEGLKEKRK